MTIDDVVEVRDPIILRRYRLNRSSHEPLITRTMKPLRAVLLVAFSPFAVHAAGPVTPGPGTPITPGAGTILQEVKPLEPPAPSQNQPGLRIEQQGRRNAAAEKYLDRAPPMRTHSSWFMVVDDSATTREVLSHQLLDEGYRVLLAEDAFDAMTKLAKTTPSLILMDIEMPKMSGIDLLRRLRGQATTSALPVIMITALKDTELRRQAIDAGVTEYFIKPLTRKGIARIRELLTTHLRHLASGSGI